MDNITLCLFTIIIISLIFLSIAILMLYNKSNIERFDEESLANISSLISNNFVFVPGMIVAWSGAANQIPNGWALCDGNNGTPDLRGRFILGYGASGDTLRGIGGNRSITLTVAQLPPHGHQYWAS